MAERKQRYGICVVHYESMAYVDRSELFDGAIVPLVAPDWWNTTARGPRLHLIRYLYGRVRMGFPATATTSWQRWSGINDRLGVALVHSTTIGVGHGRHGAIHTELDEPLRREHFECQLEHPDRPFDQGSARRHNGLRLLAPQHRARDLGRIGKMGEIAFVDRDSRDLQPVDQLGPQLRPHLLVVAAH